MGRAKTQDPRPSLSDLRNVWTLFSFCLFASFREDCVIPSHPTPATPFETSPCATWQTMSFSFTKLLFTITKTRIQYSDPVGNRGSLGDFLFFFRIKHLYFLNLPCLVLESLFYWKLPNTMGTISASEIIAFCTLLNVLQRILLQQSIIGIWYLFLIIYSDC